MPSASEDDEEWGIRAARVRLARVAALAGLRVPEDAEFLQSWSNDAWRCGDVIVRVCFRGDRARLTREAAIGAALPPEVLYPRVLDHGVDDDLSWMIVERVAGTWMWERWKTMPTAQLRPLVARIADALRTLHAWRLPADVLALLKAHGAPAVGDADEVVGHDLLPLPCPRWAPLVDAALAMPFVDAGMVRATAARVDELAPHDPFVFAGESLVHGDVNFANVIASETELTALLDYEWARLGPPDAELVSFIRAAGYWRPEPRDPRPPVVRWLQEDYPEMFAAPDLRERVWITELTYLLRQLIVWPPDGPLETQATEHPVHTLPRLVEAPWPFE